jgi:hypothetical protein
MLNHHHQSVPFEVLKFCKFAQAAERKLLSSLDVHRWHELASISSTVPLSRPELVRFRALLTAIRVVQDTALAVQVCA